VFIGPRLITRKPIERHSNRDTNEFFVFFYSAIHQRRLHSGAEPPGAESVERDLGVGHQPPAGLQAESPAVWPHCGRIRVRNCVLGQRSARRKPALALHAAFQEAVSSRGITFHFS